MEYQWVTTELPTGSGPPDPERETAARRQSGTAAIVGMGMLDTTNIERFQVKWDHTRRMRRSWRILWA